MHESAIILLSESSLGGTMCKGTRIESGAGEESMPDRPSLFIGTSGWNYFDWKGRFHPDELKAAEPVPS